MLAQVHYSSHTGPASDPESPSAVPTVLDFSQPSGSGSSRVDDGSASGVIPPTGAPSLAASGTVKKNNIKKANLYAWLSLPPLPEEMLISPTLLDFLEQAIEPIPLTSSTNMSNANKAGKTGTNTRSGIELEASATSLVSSSNYAYASFPVDVVVYVRIQPSLVRFTCLPVSRVECLLRLPSVDVVFSTKKADVEASANAADTSPSNVKSKSGRRSGAYSTRTSSSSILRSRFAAGVPADASAMDGGISVTGSLSNFSLYIFHPYGGGGGQKKATLSSLENTFRKSAAHGDAEDKTGGPNLDTGRKDSLSLNVEFVKVNISRSRKGLVPVDIHSSGSLSNSVSASPACPKFAGHDSQAANIVRFSAICDIGSASFKYDMRRLLEILALPKAWYRRSLARRMFLGEELAVPDSDSLSDDDEGMLDLSSSQSESSLFSPYEKDSDIGKTLPTHTKLAQPDASEREGAGSNSSPVPGTSKAAPGVSSAKVAADAHSAVTGGSGGGASKPVRNWETLVLFAVSLSQLDVMVNMSNVMGNTVWSTKDLKSQGRLSIDSSGYKNMKISAGLGGSKLEARGGIIGGNIELQGLESEMCISEDPGKDPEHIVSTQLHIMEARLDYMGSSILMGRISDLAVKLNDEWHVEAGRLEDRRASVATSRSVLVFVHGDLVWDRFHLMISRSTTPELIKMVHKLDEFITQQQTSSKRALSVFGPMSNASKSKVKQKDEDSWISEIRHHRHWQKVLQHMGGSRMAMLGCTLPDHGTVIGGTMSLQGHNITLACFHGINFRSKSWALFTMDEPYICFATEAADVVADGVPSTHVVQNLSFQLGQYQTDMIAEKKRMAVVCKLSRGHYMPPPFTSVQDWFHYAFATSEIKDLDTFPQMARLESDSTAPERRSAARRNTEYTHDTETIFILPSLQMHLKTEHMQGENEPKDSDAKPIVICSFVTEFEDHIFVAMDAEAVLFLHDLVMNYVKEKDRGAIARGQKSPETEPKQKLEDPTSALKQDFREFDCRTWHLEPTVRLLSWAGKRIDPVGVDYILHKLGFQHARLTIPKWTQRGCMDPLDKIISLLVDKLITTLREQDEEEEDKVT